jgi:hypothetical protein
MPPFRSAKNLTEEIALIIELKSIRGQLFCALRRVMGSRACKRRSVFLSEMDIVVQILLCLK